jgi:hypothetical protein
MLPSEVKKKEKPGEAIFPWTRAQEELLAEWSEKATCYRWLHSRSEKSYRKKNYRFTIPVIILSTLTGTANFAMDSFVPDEHKQLAMATVGSINIFAGILSTLQNFLRYAELMEAHRLSEVQWSKFGRNIEVELALDPKRRKSAQDFMKICRAEYDRLIEQSPTIDDNIIAMFKRNFKNIKIKVPAMCNGLDKCKIYEPTKEEKLESVMVHVGDKLRENRVRHWTMKDIPCSSELNTCPAQPSTGKQEAQNEIDALKSISRVSAFKQTKRSSDPENPIERVLHDITKREEPDEEPDVEPEVEPEEEPEVEPGEEPEVEPGEEPEVEPGEEPEVEPEEEPEVEPEEEPEVEP